MQQEQLIQQQTLNTTYLNENEQLSGAFLFTDTDQGRLGELVENVDFGSYGYGSEFETSYALPARTASCPPTIATKRQRKLNKNQNFEKFGDEEKSKEKICGEEEGSNKITDQNSNITTCSISSKKNKKRPYANNVSKTDYIHVRARRGEATDSHSLAERARREKLSERMKYLQDLVPGCEKITAAGKACMLDEIINYVQSLQKQVEFLSMKLALINPQLEFDNDNYLDKEVFPTRIQSLGQSVNVNPPDVTIRRTISAPITIPDAIYDSSCLNAKYKGYSCNMYSSSFSHKQLNMQQQNQNFSWDAELQDLYQQGRSATFISQPMFTGDIEEDNVKHYMDH